MKTHTRNHGEKMILSDFSIGNIDDYDINYTLMGDEIWINTNLSEAIPDVYSPFTWSISKILDGSLNFIPDSDIFLGNIYGRPYMNISRRIAVIKSILGPFSKGALKVIYDLYGELPIGMIIPLYPIKRSDAIKMMLPKAMKIARETQRASRKMKSLLAETPDWQKQLKLKIETTETPDGLMQIWTDELKPYVLKAWLSSKAAESNITKITALSKKLNKMVGLEDSSILMSNLRGKQELESLGLVRGISKVQAGELSHKQYIERYGHRGTHEFELSLPLDAENPDWIERQVKEYRTLDINVDTLLVSQRKKFDDTFVRFIERYPNKIMWLKNQLKIASEAAIMRERSRSEFVRVYRLIRLFALKAGLLSGVGVDVFFLYIDEVEQLLLDGEVKPDLIHIRRTNYEKYKNLPSFPSVIRGRFDPEDWAKDPDRRMDYYDANMPNKEIENTDMLKGHPGGAGSIKGFVRVINRFEDVNQLQPGEILVTATTNIGWTTVFPKVAAIITDIGTPLSQSVIVAREMGIPSVIGCGNATIRLKTGDKVKVDGGQGTVEIL